MTSGDLYILHTVTDRFGWQAFTVHSALEPVADYYMRHQCQNVGLFQTSTEVASVSMSGRLAADSSTSHKQLWRGIYQRLYH